LEKNLWVGPFPDLDRPLTDGVVSLRRFKLEDVDDVTRALQDSEIVKWTASIPVPYTDASARGWIEQHRQWWNDGSTASFAIDDTAVGSLLGNINVIVRPSWDEQAAMMYWVASWGRGRGVATRALRLASEWAIGVIHPQELFLETLEGNLASERVAEKAGYVFAGYRSEDFARPASRGTPETLRVKKWVLVPSPD
jgi:RimJ/RimL family protein N-acetyltransferase